MSRNIRPGHNNPGAFPAPRASREEYRGGSTTPNRSASTTRPQQDAYGSSSGNSSYSQRSRTYDRGNSEARPARSGQTLSNSSAGSGVSSGSSLLERMKVRSTDTSARTSFDEEYEPKAPAGRWAKKPTSISRHQEMDEDDTPHDPNSTGNTLWSRVVAATGTLTVNVSKAWENGIHLQDGEETPTGGETRLTKAMKAYYIEKARSPADLPPWLFAEHERRPTAARPSPQERVREGTRSTRQRGVEYEESPDYQQAVPTRGALRDVYDRVAARPPPPAKDDYSGSGYASAPPPASKATDRLRALRDAKRMQGASASRSSEEYDDRRQNARDGPRDVPVPSAPRVGLPSRPGRGVRV